jgi:hypothetical protein
MQNLQHGSGLCERRMCAQHSFHNRRDLNGFQHKPRELVERRHAGLQLLRCQYLYWCISKASKLARACCTHVSSQCSALSDSICTHVLVKQVHCAPPSAASKLLTKPLHRLPKPLCYSLNLSITPSAASKLPRSSPPAPCPCSLLTKPLCYSLNLAIPPSTASILPRSSPPAPRPCSAVPLVVCACHTPVTPRYPRCPRGPIYAYVSIRSWHTSACVIRQ